MNRFDNWGIFSPVGRFAVLSALSCIASATIIDLANDHIFDDLQPEAKLALALPTLVVISWASLLFIWTLPRALGQWIVARRQGFKLAWLVFWPIYIGIGPERQLLLNWKQPFFRVARIWRSDGIFDPEALKRAVQAGLAMQVILAGIFLIASLLSRDEAWRGLLLLLGIISLVGAIVGSSSDRNLLSRLRQSPSAVEGEDAVMQIRALRASSVPRTRWPAGLERVALDKSVGDATRAGLHWNLIAESAMAGDLVAATLAIERGLEDQKTWPVKSYFALTFKLQVAYILAAALFRPDRARLILSETQWPTSHQHLYSCAVVAVTAYEQGVSEGQEALLRFKGSLRKSSWRVRAKTRSQVKFLESVLKNLEGMAPADFEVQTLWAKGVRPRLWHRRLIEELASSHDLALHRANRAVARLAYWEDIGDEQRCEEVVREILSLADFEDLPPAEKQRLWAEAALYFALIKGELRPAADAMVEAEDVEFSGKRSLLAAQAAVFALEGNKIDALSRLEELTLLLKSLPPWATRYEEEHERIVAIRELANVGG